MARRNKNRKAAPAVTETPNSCTGRDFGRITPLLAASFEPGTAPRSIPAEAILALSRSNRPPRNASSSPQEPETALAIGVLAARVRELEGSLDLAGERLQRSLRRQGELEARAAADRETAGRLFGAEKRATSLADSLARTEERLAALEREASNLRGEREYLSEELAELRRLLGEREKTLATLAAESGKERLAIANRLDESERTAQEHARERARLEARVESLQFEISRMESQLAERERVLAEAARLGAEERERLDSELRQARENAWDSARSAAAREADLREQLGALRTREDALRSEQGRLEESLEAATARVRALEGEADSRSEELEEARNAHGRLGEELTAVRVELGEVRSAREELNALLEAREQTLREELSAARHERERSEATITELRDSIREIDATREVLAERAEKLHGELERERSERGSESATLREELGATQERAESARTAAEQRGRELERVRGELARLEDERAQLIAALEAREETLRSELASAREERDRQAHALAQAQGRLTDFTREHERATNKARQLEADLEELRARAMQDRDRAKNLAGEAMSLEEKLQRISAEHERAKATAREAGESRAQLEEKLARLESESAEAASRAEKAERRLRLAEAGRAELERRADAAEGLLRERLRAASGGSVQRAAGEQSAPLPDDLTARLIALEQATRSVEARLGEINESPSGDGARPMRNAELNALEEQTRRIEETLRELHKSSSTESTLPDQLESALARLVQASQAQGRELQALSDRLSSLDGHEKALSNVRALPLRTGEIERRRWMAAAVAALVLVGVVTAMGWGIYRGIIAQVAASNQALVQQLSERLVAGATARKAATPLSAPRLTRPPAGATVRLDRVDLAGQAEDAEAAFLYLGGTLYAVELVRDGKFSFPKVPLQEGKNLVAIRAFSAEGGASEIYETVLLRPREPGAPPEPRVKDLLRGPTNRREIALTFDADEARGAQTVLDTLARYGIQTTIFLTGQFIVKHPELVKRMVADGHEVGNHLWDHPHLTTFDENSRHDTRSGMTKSFFQSQLIRTASRFEEVTGRQMSGFWRAPYGEVNAELMRWAQELGYQHVNWTRDYSRGETLDSLDWVTDPDSHNYFTNDEIVERLVSFGEGTPQQANGGIVLMHLNTRRSEDSAVHARLGSLIERWREAGYRFVKVSEMIGRSDASSG